jgi:hypothetical protein
MVMSAKFLKKSPPNEWFPNRYDGYFPTFGTLREQGEVHRQRGKIKIKVKVNIYFTTYR